MAFCRLHSSKYIVELLSKQRHYDWGLRAVKSVLRQAGKLKRDPDNEKMSEDPLLMRALRDFNLPKIVNFNIGNNPISALYNFTLSNGVLTSTFIG